jgi:hypothetical protein
MSSGHCLTGNVQFRRILLAHGAAEPDFDLFRYAATIASVFGAEQTLVAVTPGHKDPGSLVRIARSAFDSRSGKLDFRLLIQSDPAALLEIAAEQGAELVMTPSLAPAWNGSLEQLAFESRCPVWFVPQRFGTRLRRAMVRVDPPDSTLLLGAAAAACKAAGVEELVVAHVFSQFTLDQDAASLRRFERERTLELYRFLARIDISGMNCTPLVEESLRPVDALIRMVKRYEPDAIFDSLSWPGIQCKWSRSEASRFLRALGIPLINIPAPGDRPARSAILKSRVFPESEPSFS